MKELTLQDLKSITEARTAPMISIYLSRDSRTDTKPFPERWKHSLQKAEGLLLKDYTRSFVHAFLEPLRQATFYRHLEPVDKGLIVFHSPQEQGFLRVQTAIHDLVVVADSFHIKPLLRIRNNEKGYFLISVTPKNITVYVETNAHLYRLDSIRNSELDDQMKGAQLKAATRAFFTDTALSINKTLAQYKLPVILAGASDETHQMKKLLQSPFVLDDVITGTIEQISKNEIRQRCFDLLEPYYRKRELEAVTELKLAIKQNQAIIFIEDIALSAVLGKVEKLFVVENRQIWGRVNHRTGEISITPRQTDSHDDDILDDISQIVLSRGGEVFVIQDPKNTSGFVAAAIVSDTAHLYETNQAYFTM